MHFFPPRTLAKKLPVETRCVHLSHRTKQKKVCEVFTFMCTFKAIKYKAFVYDGFAKDLLQLKHCTKRLETNPKVQALDKRDPGLLVVFLQFFFSLHGKQANSGVYISDLFVEPPLHIIFIKLTSSIVIKIKIFPETHTGIIINCRLTGPILTSNSTLSQF